MVTEKEYMRRYVAYSGKSVRLNDYPARIVGYRLDFATVATWGAKSPRVAVEYAWPTVDRIVAAGGDFRA